MKKQISYLAIVVLSAGFFFSSCKKENKTEVDTTTQVKVQADDEARFTSETDAVADDANAAVENEGGSYAGESPIGPRLLFACDATIIVDTANTQKTITITYNGNCLGNRTRTGSIAVSFNSDFRWGRAGASYTVTFNQLKITRGSDSKSIILNGSKTITNVSGGKLRNLATRGSAIVHEVHGENMSVTFDDGTQRSWKIAKKRTFTYDGGVVLKVAGIRTPDDKVAEWGVNRFNNDFTSAIIEPLTIKQSCGFRLVSGQIKHVSLFTTVTTFGLDASGNAVACPGPFYYKVEWTAANGTTYSYIGRY
jgi:hypothetical protein